MVSKNSILSTYSFHWSLDFILIHKSMFLLREKYQDLIEGRILWINLTCYPTKKDLTPVLPSIYTHRVGLDTDYRKLWLLGDGKRRPKDFGRVGSITRVVIRFRWNLYRRGNRLSKRHDDLRKTSMSYDVRRIENKYTTEPDTQ